jgi:hypothetical protein
MSKLYDQPNKKWHDDEPEWEIQGHEFPTEKRVYAIPVSGVFPEKACAEQISDYERKPPNEAVCEK